MYDSLEKAVARLIVRLQKYYDKVFKPLDDVLQMLPDIFKENMQYITVKDTEESWLISPLEFERKNAQSVKAAVNQAAASFLTDLHKNIRSWLGYSIDEIDAQISGVTKTDVSGFISRFIETYFEKVLTVSIDNLILNSLNPSINFNSYMLQTLTDLQKNAIPLYRPSAASKAANVKGFSFLSIPVNCFNTINVAVNSFKSGTEIKKSGEKSKITVIKVIYGMPIYAFARAEEMEAAYMESYEKLTGVHLRSEWKTQLASPIPEGCWSPGYANELTTKRNERNRRRFKTCVESGIIKMHEDGTSAMLYVPTAPINIEDISLIGTLPERKKQLVALREKTWNTAGITLAPCGSYVRGANGIMDNICENTLRFFNLCEEIEKQSKSVTAFNRLYRRLEDTTEYAWALIIGMIYTETPFRYFRKSETDAMPRKLLNLAENADLLKNYYLEFIAFSDALTDEEKENIKARKESLLIRLKQEDVKTKTLNRLEKIKKTMEGASVHVDEAILRVTADEARNMRSELNFYTDIRDICAQQIEFINRIYSQTSVGTGGPVDML